VELLAATGAIVTVIAEDFDPIMEQVAQGDYSANISLEQRPWGLQDMQGKKLVIADMETEADAYAARCAARGAGVPVNVVDKPDFCDFSFATIVNRSPVIVAISTDGAAPILGQELRQRIERLLPTTLGDWSAAAKAFRITLAQMMPEKPLRRRFWQAFAQKALSSTAPEGSMESALRALAISTNQQAHAQNHGRVSFVGAGPGDADLLTLKAVRRLQEADVILHDALVSPQVLELARREAERVNVGKRGGGQAMAQEEIDALIVEHALNGKIVVRLKGGDPAIFGRLESELAAVRIAGIAFDIVPGITTASALASAAAVPLTAKQKAASLTLYSGHDFAREDSGVEEQSLMFYMPKAAANTIVEKLTARGFNAQTPCLIGVAISTPSEQAVKTTLARLSSELRALSTDKPVIVAVGEIFR
jgi:uroporphyrin-III C-methyltransferase/precorrin-2 dehydrogenase/sirohydrochlorin ferrochelatase